MPEKKFFFYIFLHNGYKCQEQNKQERVLYQAEILALYIKGTLLRKF